MDQATAFLLKDSPPELIAAAAENGKGIPKGRTYTKEFSEQPGAIHIDDLVLGMKYASLSITDDKPKTLKNVGKSNPWHIEALTVITGSEEAAHQPLTQILKEHMDLTCDHIIDISGFSSAGHALDTQGYIAHNDKVIVLSYRCTTSANDWLTNLTTTSSEWDPEVDIPQGHSGYISAMSGLCCNETYKPRVHTGFYNNFLVSAPLIQEHIEPLLAPDQPPRKLYVVGHSLGAGIATMAACYFILKHNWAELPHKVINVTAGCPRACQESMAIIIQQEMVKLRPLDKAVICRIVRDRDVVPTLPPSTFGFAHLDKLVFITEDGEILINPVLADEHMIDQDEMKFLVKNTDILITPEQGTDDTTPVAAAATTSDIAAADVTAVATITDAKDAMGSADKEADTRAKVTEPELAEADETTEKTEYERLVSMIPRRFRDHMPDFYLKPLIKLFEVYNPPPLPLVEDVKDDAPTVLALAEPEKDECTKKKKGILGFFKRNKSGGQTIAKK